DRKRRGERQLLHVLAIGRTEHKHATAVESAHGSLELVDADPGHMLVGLPPITHQAQLAIGCIAEQEVWINRDAVSAHPEAWAVDVRERLGVRGLERLADVDVAARRVKR